MKKYFVLLSLVIVVNFAYADRTTIYDVQYTTDPGGASPLVNQTVTLTGVVTATFYSGYVIAEESGPWHALYVFTQKNGPTIGDLVTVTGRITEYYSMTEMDNVSSFEKISSGNAIEPFIVDTQSASQERFESVLLKVMDISVTGLETFAEFLVSDGSSPLRCNDMNDYMYFAKVGDYFESITGILFYSFENFKLEPRNTMDLVGSKIPHYAIAGDIITMNDSREIIENAYIEILGDKIVGVSQTAPDVDIINVDGLIFPGLIDAHNHPLYNVLDWIPFPCTFADRAEWQDHSMYDDFNSQWRGIRDYGGSYAQSNNLWKLAEVRNLCSGGTMIQGYNCNNQDDAPIAHQGLIINNAERFPSKIYSSTFPLNYQSDWTRKSGEYWDRFIIHLSEGFSSEALAEFDTWVAWGFLDWRTSIIHGVAYGTEEWNLMAGENASLIWSPRSNMLLYEQTADIPGALTAGVNVALAPDWTESGEPNPLAELHYANELNQTLWGGSISAQQFIEMVTRNAAYALGMQNRVGQIQTNFQADLMVIPGDPSAPYDALLASNPADVKLTVVSGRPMYGNPEIFDSIEFINPSELDTIYICEIQKKLAIRMTANGIEDSSKPISDVLAELQTAFNASYPKLCNFLNYDPCGGGPTPTPSPSPTGATATPTPIIPTFTPTTGPGTPTNTPMHTPTPVSCGELGVTLWMPSQVFTTGSPCSLEARICNPNNYSFLDIPLFVILEVYGSYYFAPTFTTELNYYIIDEFFPGQMTQVVIPEFQWPEGAGQAENLKFYGAMTDKAITKLFGDYGIFTFGWNS